MKVLLLLFSQAVCNPKGLTFDVGSGRHERRFTNE
jgi:hypothetical protein